MSRNYVYTGLTNAIEQAMLVGGLELMQQYLMLLIRRLVRGKLKRIRKY